MMNPMEEFEKEMRAEHDAMDAENEKMNAAMTAVVGDSEAQRAMLKLFRALNRHGVPSSTIFVAMLEAGMEV